MNREALHASLHTLHVGLERCDTGAWLFGGLLLGLARSGDVIPWDRDVDVSILRARSQAFVSTGIRDLVSAGFAFSGAWINNDGQLTELTFRRRGFKFDVFLVDELEGRFQWHYYWRRVQRVRGCQAHGLTETVFGACAWRVPADLDAYLTALYGNWRVPDRKYHYMRNRRGLVSSVVWRGQFERSIDRVSMMRVSSETTIDRSMGPGSQSPIKAGD